jgi:hypothetical protein
VEPTPKDTLKAEDDDPRAARNFQDDTAVYPAASAKKKELATAARKPTRTRPAAPIKPARSVPPVEREAAGAVPPAPAPPAKKSSTLDDLFNDTK